MEKKKMTNKKKFWIGMSSLAAVGVITATVAYFSSQHRYSNQFKNQEYKVTTTQVFDRESAQSMVPGQIESLDINVTNKGDTPVLARIKYVSLSDDELKAKNWDTDKDGFVEQTELPINAFDDYTGINIQGTFGGMYGEDFQGIVAEGTNFEKGDDGYYYYKGILRKNGEAHHLGGIKLLANGTLSHATGDTPEYNTDGSENWIEDKGGVSNSTIKKYRITSTSGTATCNLFAVIETIQATNETGAELEASNLTDVTSVATAWSALTNPQGV